MSSLLIKDGYVVLGDQIVRTNVYVEDGKISAVGSSVPGIADVVVDAHGKYVIPGAIDEHVHCREPGLTYKEDFTTCTKSAAAGGVTTVYEMPNTLPPVDDASRLKEKASLLKDRAYVDFALYGVLHSTNLDRFDELVDAGAIGFKVFLGPTTGNIPPPDDGALYEILSRAARRNVTVAFHAENNDIVNFFTEKLKRTGRTDPSVHMEARPPIAEEEAIRRIALFSLRTGGRALIVHVSSREGIEAIREAREQGARVYGETCPHYLVLDSTAYSRYGSLIKVNPPIRTNLDMEALWNAVNSEIITNVGSDHAPHTPEEKRGSIWDAASGIIGVQTMLPILLDSALKGRTTISRVVKLVSEMPARLFGLYGRKGVIAPGADADLVVFDPSEGFSIREEWLYSKSKISPFIGWELRGKIERVYLRGNEIYDGESVTERRGDYIRADLLSS